VITVQGSLICDGISVYSVSFTDLCSLFAKKTRWKWKHAILTLKQSGNIGRLGNGENHTKIGFCKSFPHVAGRCIPHTCQITGCLLYNLFSKLLKRISRCFDSDGPYSRPVGLLVEVFVLVHKPKFEVWLVIGISDIQNWIELHNLYSLQHIITIIKPRRMRWAGHVACMGAKRNAYRILVGKQKERNH
jgi:hypothetical protein